MDRLRGWWKQLRALAAKDRVERELDEEIVFHLQMETDRLIREGASPEVARRAARLAFGGVERTKEEVRDGRWIRGFENFLADLRYGARTLRSKPGFATAAILTLALGIGGTTAVFSVVRAVLLEPLPYERPGQLVRLYQLDVDEPEEYLFVSAPHFQEYRQRASSFESLAALYTYHEVGADLLVGDRAQRIVVLPVSADYFRLLRREPVLGRGFSREEETGEPLAVVSAGLWRRAGLDREGLGATIELDGEGYTVVGVMPAGFEDPLAGPVDAWLPQNLRVGAMVENPGNHFLSVLGRLAPGVTVEQAREEMAALDAALAEKYPDVASDGGFHLVALQEDLVARARPALLAVLGAVVLVLLIACVNLANLQLVRSLGRLREVAVRSALGAEPGRITLQLLVESAVVAAAGGLAGVAVAFAGLRGLLRLGREAIPRSAEIAIDGPVLAVAAVLALGTGTVAGLLPAWRLARTSPSASLGESSRSATGGRPFVRLRRALVAAQVGLALTLLVGASALGASVYRLSQVDLGFRPAGVLTFQINLPAGRYDGERRAAFHPRLGEVLAALPGVSAVGATTVLPATGTSYNWGTRALTGPNAGAEEGFIDADQRIVAGSYFEVLEIPIVEGRAFDERDGPDAAPVAVVSRSLARHLFPGVSPLGQEIRMGGVERRIVGVAGDVALDPEGAPGRYVYHANAQWASFPATLEYLVAAEGDAEAHLPAVRSAVAALDPQLVVHRPVTLDEVVRRGRSHRRFAFALTAAFALLALALAGIGLYGVLAYVVRQRTREIGIRVAMGAGPGRVVAMVLRDGLGVTLAGLAAGTVGSLALGGLLSSLVFRTEPTEPLVLVAAAAILAGTAAVATLIPAWRALRVSPRAALAEP
jgi:putative ABC transport system permease protein